MGYKKTWVNFKKWLLTKRYSKYKHCIIQTDVAFAKAKALQSELGNDKPFTCNKDLITSGYCVHLR